MGDLDFSINIDATEMLMDLQQVDEVRQNVEAKSIKTIEFVNKTSLQAYKSSLALARGIWHITETIVSGMGGTISTQFKAIMAASLGLGTALYPVLHAALTTGLATLNPAQVAAAILGITEVGMAMVSLAQADQEQKQLDMAWRTSISVMNSVQMMVRGFNF